MSICSISPKNDALTLRRTLLDALIREQKLLLGTADMTRLGFGSPKHQNDLIAAGVLDPPVRIGASNRKFHLATNVLAAVERFQPRVADDPALLPLRARAAQARAVRLAKRAAAKTAPVNKNLEPAA